VLLWQRAQEPFAAAGRSRRLPRAGETLEQSIRRHLAEKVDVRELAHLEQLETRSEPERSPHEWQLATAYLGLVRATPIRAFPTTPSGIRSTRCRRSRSTTSRSCSPGRERLRAKLSYTNIGFALAPRSSRSRSFATSTPPRSATTSRRRTSSACCCAAACSSRPAACVHPAGRRAPGHALPLPDAERSR
jgi:ADP-ribose pyrophosphatase YjhB (NUDIX family)